MIKYGLPVLLLVLSYGCDHGTDSSGPGQAAIAAGEPVPAAHTLLINGRVYTVNPAQPWAETIAVRDGRILFAGSDAEAAAYRGPETEVIDLEGKMAMPGLNDLHVHPVYGFTVQLFECVFPGTATPEVVRQTVSQCVADYPDAEWIIGGQWETDFFIKHDIPSPRRWLDEISGDKAVILRDTSFHNRWVNSKALELAGLTRDSPEIPGGQIVRDEDTGEPNGLLYETASRPVLSIIPDWTEEQYLQAARESMRAANRFGLTGIKEAWATLQGLKAYKTLADRGEISVHLVASMSVLPMLDEERNLDAGILEQMRTGYRGKNVNTDAVKISMDGVPSASRTAAMLADYTPEYEGAPTHSGRQHYTQEELSRLIVQLDKLGMTAKVHTAGDRSVRVTLNAIEAARHANGHSGMRHELAHAGYVDEADIPRFAELDAVAEISPYIWFPSVKVDSIIRAVGEERGKRYWPVRDLLDAGAQVVAGSDWPAGALSSMNPWVGLEAMVSRANPWGLRQDRLWGEQAITLEQALEIYTRSGAKALLLEQESGSLEPGKLADIIVLEHNLFEIPVESISETQVFLTMFEGRIVYRMQAPGIQNPADPG